MPKTVKTVTDTSIDLFQRLYSLDGDQVFLHDLRL